MIYTTFDAFKNYVNHYQPGLLFSNKENATIVVTGSYRVEDYFPSHRAIFVPFTGTNGIDIKLLYEKGILLFNSQAHSHYVAERALALILTLLGKMIPYHQGLTAGHWANRNSRERIPWTSLFKKRVGFLGYGMINQILHDLLKPFDIDAYTLDRGKNYQGVTSVKDLETLVHHSDIVVMALPLNGSTEKIMNASLLRQMKDKFLINVGRGGTIDETALYQALQNETLRGFASDVWWEYPNGAEPKKPSKYPLEIFNNVVMTPHSGGFTETALDERFNDTLRKINAFLEGEYKDALDLQKLLKYNTKIF